MRTSPVFLILATLLALSLGTPIATLAQNPQYDTVEVQVTAGLDPLPNASVALDLNNNGVWDEHLGEPRDWTDADGIVYFDNVTSVGDDPYGQDWRPTQIMFGNLRGAVGARDVQIDFLLPQDATSASLGLFDLRGRRIAQAHGPGDLELNLPRGLPSGVYFLRLSAGSAEPASQRITSVGSRTRSIKAHRVSVDEAMAAGWAGPRVSDHDKRSRDPQQINLIVEHDDYPTVVQAETLVPGANSFTVDVLAGPPPPTYTPADETMIISESDQASILAYDPSSGAITIDGSAAYAGDIEVGSVLIGQNDDTAPDGFLRRVSGVVIDGGNLLLTTEPALMTDAFEQMALSSSLQLRPSQIESMNLRHGTRFMPDKDDLTFSLALDCVLYDHDGDHDTTNDQIKLTGHYTFTASFFADIDISWFTLNKLEMGIDTSEEVGVDLTASIEWEFPSPLEFHLWDVRLGAYPLGGAVWIVPTLGVKAHIHGDMTVTFETGITSSQVIRKGFGYDRQQSPNYYAISESSQTFTYSPPSIEVAFNFEAGPSLNASCMLYGVAGPYMVGKMGLHFQSVLDLDPCDFGLTFDLAAIMYAGVGVHMNAYIFDLDYGYIFELYNQPIGSWGFPLGNFGTVAVEIDPEDLEAPWTIVGPCDFGEDGAGAEVFEELRPGDYTITWGDIVGWVTPSPVSVTETLATGEEIVFAGVYVAQEGTIVIDPEPDVINAPWHLAGPEGYELSGNGDLLLEEMAVGGYTLTWGEVEGWIAPIPASVTGTLEHGGGLVFEGEYSEDSGPTPPPGFEYIPPGTFMMGSPTDEPGRVSNETQHQVTLTQGFYMSRYEVTEEWWYQVMGGTPTTSQLPKSQVSWDLAVQFCNALSVQEGLTPAYTIHGINGNVTWNQGANGYRLPTEAEWEYACRATTTMAYHNDTNCLDSTTEANFRGNSHQLPGCSLGIYRGARTEVGSFPANQWGLYDMHGNLWEWVWCGRRTYTSSPQVDPVHNVGPGDSRGLRGGAWYYDAPRCRSARRDSYLTFFEISDFGFRPVRSAH